jgi:aspartate 1-decarboxylase
MIGDLLIIAAYSSYDEEELKVYQAVIVLVGERNRLEPQLPRRTA